MVKFNCVLFRDGNGTAVVDVKAFGGVGDTLAGEVVVRLGTLNLEPCILNIFDACTAFDLEDADVADGDVVSTTLAGEEDSVLSEVVVDVEVDGGILADIDGGVDDGGIVRVAGELDGDGLAGVAL